MFMTIRCDDQMTCRYAYQTNKTPVPKGFSTGAILTPRLGLLNRFYREHDVTVGRAYRDRLPDAVAHQGAAKRTLVGNTPHGRIGLGRADKLKDFLVLAALFLNLDLITEIDHVFGAAVVDNLRVAQDCFQPQNF